MKRVKLLTLLTNLKVKSHHVMRLLLQTGHVTRLWGDRYMPSSVLEIDRAACGGAAVIQRWEETGAGHWSTFSLCSRLCWCRWCRWCRPPPRPHCCQILALTSRNPSERQRDGQRKGRSDASWSCEVNFSAVLLINHRESKSDTISDLLSFTVGHHTNPASTPETGRRSVTHCGHDLSKIWFSLDLRIANKT